MALPGINKKYIFSIRESRKSEAEEIFNYFKLVREKYSRKSSNIKFKTISEYLKKRCRNGLTLEGAKQVIDYKFKEWWGTDMQRHLNFKTLLGPTHYDNYLINSEMDDSSDNEFLDTM